MREHPLYEFAMSLEDTDPEPLDDIPRTMH